MYFDDFLRVNAIYGILYVYGILYMVDSVIHLFNSVVTSYFENPSLDRAMFVFTKIFHIDYCQLCRVESSVEGCLHY